MEGRKQAGDSVSSRWPRTQALSAGSSADLLTLKLAGFFLTSLTAALALADTTALVADADALVDDMAAARGDSSEREGGARELSEATASAAAANASL